MAKSTPLQCQATTKSGRPCSATPRPGRLWCAWHDPELAGRRKEWSTRGGENKSNLKRARKAIATEPLTMTEVQGYLGHAMRGVLAGEIEPGVGTAVANIARAIQTITVAAEIEERLTALERSAWKGRTA